MRSVEIGRHTLIVTVTLPWTEVQNEQKEVGERGALTVTVSCFLTEAM